MESRSSLLPLLVLSLLAAVAIWRALVAGPPGGDDWGQYLSHARALLEGRPYSDIGYLFSPAAWTVGPATFPPGVPLTLVPLLTVSDDATVLSALVMHGFLFGFLAFVWLYFDRQGERTLAWGTVALLGTGFLLRDSATYVNSDLGMCAFIWGVIALGDRSETWSPRRTGLIGALGLAAILYRVAAVPIIAAILWWSAVRCVRARRMDLAWRPLAIGLLWTVTFGIVFTTFAAGTGVIESAGTAIGANDGGALTESLTGSLRHELAQLDGKILRYRYTFSETYLYAFPTQLANNAYHAIALALTLIGLWVWTRSAWHRLGAAFCMATIVFLLAAPVWSPRYAWVLMPFIAFGFLRGIATCAERTAAPQRARKWAAATAAVVSLIAVGTAVSTSRPPSLPSNLEWREMGRAVQASSARPVRAASNRPRALTWLTRIPAAGMARELEPFLADVDRLELTHVVISRRANEEFEVSRFDSWRDSAPELFELVETVGELEAYRITRNVR